MTEQLSNHESSQPGEIELVTNDSLLAIASALSELPQDFSLDDALERYKNTNAFVKNRRDLGELRGGFFEFLLWERLADLQQKQFAGIVDLDPITEDLDHPGHVSAQSESPFTFTKHRGIVSAHWRETTEEHNAGDTIAEYDALIRVGGLVCVIEAKALESHSARKKSLRYLKAAMHDKEIKRKLAPLQDYFGTNRFGYLVVVTKGVLSETSTTQAEFLKKGGLLVELPFSYQELTNKLILEVTS